MLILLERSFSPKELIEFQNQYSIKLPHKDPNGKNEVGLMVIKKVEKTKAFQKTTCIRNWKRFFKSVMLLLKENNYKGVQLLEMWANKDVKVIKTKKVKKEFSWDQYGKADKKPPIPEPVRLKFSLENNKNEQEPKNSLKKQDVDESLLKKRKELFKADENTPTESSNSSSICSEKTPDSYTQNTTVFNRYLSKKTFYPNQTSKIYPGVSTSFSTLNNTSVDVQNDYQFNIPKQVNISPVRENSKLDIGDIKRPFSSSLKQNGEGYIKKDKLPKFAHKQPNLIYFSSESKSPDENMSIDSDNGMNIFKQNSSPDDQENRENESQI